jgi:hypothetical protein
MILFSLLLIAPAEAQLWGGCIPASTSMAGCVKIVRKIINGM